MIRRCMCTNYNTQSKYIYIQIVKGIIVQEGAYLAEITTPQNQGTEEKEGNPLKKKKTSIHEQLVK